MGGDSLPGCVMRYSKGSHSVQTLKRLPIDIPSPRGAPLSSGAVLIHPTRFGELEEFWRTHREDLPYSAEGSKSYEGEQEYLAIGDWVFGPTKISVIKAVTRWDELDADCEWFDWASANPEEHAAYFVDRAIGRDKRREAGTWTEEDEQAFRSRTTENHRGWWEYKNLPFELTDILAQPLPVEVYSAATPKQVALSMLQEALFDQGLDGRSSQMGYQITLRDPKEFEIMLAMFREDEELQNEVWPPLA